MLSLKGVAAFLFILYNGLGTSISLNNWGLPCNNFFRQMRWLEIYLKIKRRNIRQKKYVAVEDPKLHKIDRVNFFLQFVFFPKKN